MEAPGLSSWIVLKALVTTEYYSSNYLCDKNLFKLFYLKQFY